MRASDTNCIVAIINGGLLTWKARGTPSERRPTGSARSVDASRARRLLGNAMHRARARSRHRLRGRTARYIPQESSAITYLLLFQESLGTMVIVVTVTSAVVGVFLLFLKKKKIVHGDRMLVFFFFFFFRGSCF